MNIFLFLSFIVNLVILMPLCFTFFYNREGIGIVYGEDTTARQILVSMYLTIIIFSIVALIDSSLMMNIAMVLFPFQIIYKLLSLSLIKNKETPVYWFNLFVAAFHSITVTLVFF